MYRNYREKSRKIIYIFSFNFEVYGERDMYSPDYEMELLVLIVLNSFYFLTGFNIRLFCLIIVFTIFIIFFFIFRRIAHCRKSCNLWLDYDFYLLNSETPPSSRQTVVVEQIKAPSVFKDLIKKKYNNIRKYLLIKISKK